MPSLWFIVPAHGRAELTRICLRQLRRTCDELEREGIGASAVVVACDENLDTARDLGFAMVRRDNRFLSRRFNDGIQLACDPQFNARPADYVVPCGSDDWVHPDLFKDLPPPDTVVGFQHCSFVREDGREMTHAFVNYPGGCGVRVFPRELMALMGYRPAEEDRRRGCDTSILVNLRREVDDLKIRHDVYDPRMIVDWKSPGQQLNSYTEVGRYQAHGLGNPFAELEEFFCDEALSEMQAHYARELVAA